MTRCLLVSSLEELMDAAAGGFSGPAFCIPFGADPTVPSKFFGSVEDITGDDLDYLLEFSYPAPCGTRRVHLIESPPRFIPETLFYMVET